MDELDTWLFPHRGADHVVDTVYLLCGHIHSGWELQDGTLGVLDDTAWLEH